ncbi:MAG: hypothetical protein HQK70_01250 [Desulfamplus sp.]|nr:hypothetical protein [Desulfamplus sp.]
MKTTYCICKTMILSLLISYSICFAAQIPEYVPENLKPWSGWVLHGKTMRIDCIPNFNDPDAIHCALPTSIVLNLNNNGGEFKQEWQIYHETYITLPGNSSNWPKDVMADNTPAVIIQQNDTYGNILPVVKLLQGRHTITGRFVWQKQPEYIQISSESALIKLFMDNREVEFPTIDDTGRLWLKNKTVNVEEQEENRLKIESFRLIDDSIPSQMLIYATLDVAGAAREVKLGPLYSPKKFIPLNLDSSLPSKLESDGTIRIQLKPGRHSLTLNLRHIGNIESLEFEPPDDGYWSKQEIWSVVRHPDLRIVEISGVSSVDPRMTSLPEEWKSYPAYIMTAKESMKFKEIKRGDPVPPPDQLNLNRTLWLAFDGTGYTVQDRITGKKNSGWRLEMESLMKPGKVTVDGVEQLITNMDLSKHSESKPPNTAGVEASNNTAGVEQSDRKGLNFYKNAGVELRRGIIDLVAESKIEGSVYTIPATGWRHSFQKVTGQLNLPPGWKLVSAKGVDNIQGTWIKRWSLLDIFIVLIFTIATAKLFSMPLAFVGFITMVLLYHEPDAPRYVWLFLILGFAFNRAQKELNSYSKDTILQSSTSNRETQSLTDTHHRKFGKMVNLYQFIVLISLLVISVPYAVNSLRIGIYPQLENRWISMNDAMQNQPQMAFEKFSGSSPSQLPTEALPEAPADGYNMQTQYREESKGQSMDAMPSPRKAKSPLAYLKSEKESLESQINDKMYGQENKQRSKIMQYDPKSLTQTGPGLPLWQPFRTINFSWSGPVEQGQTTSFILVGPIFNLVLAFVRVALIILLTLGMVRASGLFKGKLKTDTAKILIYILISASIFIIVNPCVTNSGEIPSKEMLAELQKRLLEKDRCFPSCADISQMEISIIKPEDIKTDEQLVITLDVDAAVDTAIPLPGHALHWLPEQVIINGQSSGSLFRYGQNIWAMIPKGKNVVVVQGRIGNQSIFQLPLALKPHSGKINNLNGWEVQGVQPDSTLDDQLQFKRLAEKRAKGEKSQQEQEILATGLLPPFALVERTLLLGLDWKVETTVSRLSPTGSAIVLNLPLLEGESVITEGVRVKNGMAEVTLNASQNNMAFESFLETAEIVKLHHALSADSKQNLEWTEIWRLDASPIFHVDTEGIPVILHQSNERWYPTWHPLPGEEVILKISKPKGIGGQTMTIEKSTLELHPGQKTTRSILNLSIKSSQGGQHSITIPEKAELQEVKINSEVQLIRQEGQKVVLPITPGSQNVELIWKDANEIVSLYRTPKINLGTSSVNAAIDLHISSDRWTLFVGGEQLMGPAVLFWSKIIVVLLVSIGLAMSGLTPLKFYQWFLLGIGMSMSSAPACIFVAAWLVILDFRRKYGEKNIYDNKLTRFRFNLIQIGIVGLTFFAVMSLVFAVSQGLLGHPSMNITGNGSSGNFFRWYQDISDADLPVAWVFSLPMFAYRLAMLLWALWLSFWLISILKWGWSNFASPVIWLKSTKAAPAVSSDDSASEKNEAEQTKDI